MADTQIVTGIAEAGSFKDKLLQPSDRDELSGPDQQAARIKPPPSKDAGSPPMTVSITEAPAGADDSGAPPSSIAAAAAAAAAPTQGVNTTDIKTSNGGNGVTPDDTVKQSLGGGGQSDMVAAPRGNLWSPPGNTQSPIDARHRFQHGGSGAAGTAARDYQLPQGVAAVVPQPQHVDDYPDQQEVVAAGAGDRGGQGVDKGSDISGEAEGRQMLVAAASDDAADGAAAADSGGSRRGGFSAPEPEPDTTAAAEDDDVGDQGLAQQKPLAAATKAAAETLKPMAAAVSKPMAAVTKPVAAAMSQLKSVVIDSGDDVMDLDEIDLQNSEIVKEAEKDAVEVEGGEKIAAFAVL